SHTIIAHQLIRPHSPSHIPYPTLFRSSANSFSGHVLVKVSTEEIVEERCELRFVSGTRGRIDPCAEPLRVIATRIVKNAVGLGPDRKSTRLNSSHQIISYAVFCLKKKR